MIVRNKMEVWKYFTIVFTLSVISAYGECPNGWTRYESSCYLFSHLKLNFFDAENFCHQEGGYLTHIETKAENAFLRSFCDDLKVARRWIGMTDQVVEGQWLWHGPNTAPTFFDWGPSQPDYGKRSNCGALWEAYSYKWCDEPCANKYEPICERPFQLDVEAVG